MSVSSTYGARSIKRKRRTKAEIEQVETAIYAALLIDKPMTRCTTAHTADSFAISCVFEHGGKMPEAVRGAAVELGVEH